MGERHGGAEGFLRWLNYHRTTAPTLMPGVHLIVFLVFVFSENAF